MKNLFIIFLIFLSACGDTAAEEKPVNILDKSEIIPVIVDLQILESHFQRQFSRVDLYRDALDSSSEMIFVDHGISKELFSSSLDYYAQTPDTLFTIYEAALDSVKFRMNAQSSGNADSSSVITLGLEP